LYAITNINNVSFHTEKKADSVYLRRRRRRRRRGERQ
jgi:hypothetical protein